MKQLKIYLCLILMMGFGPPLNAQEEPDDGLIAALEFQNIPLADALRQIADHAQISIVPSPEAAKTEISLTFYNVAPLSALDAITRSYNLKMIRDDSGIVRIYTVEEYQRDLKNFRNEQIKVFTLLYPNVIDVAVAIRDLFGEQIQLSMGADPSDLTDEIQERFDRFDILDEKSQTIGFLNGGNSGNSSSSSSSSSDGDDSDSSGEGGSQNTVTQGRKSTASIFISVIRQHNMLVVRTGDSEMLKRIGDLIQRLDVPVPLVLLEVKVMQIELQDDFNSIFEFAYSDEKGISSGFAQGSILVPDSDESGGERRGLSVQPGGTGLTQGNFIFAAINKDIHTRMSLLESDNRVTTLATPFILTVNNEVSRLFVGEEVPLNRSFEAAQTLVAGTTSSTVPGGTDIEFRPVGTTIFLTPNINADRSVSIRILQETSSLSTTPASVLVPSATGFVSANVDIVRARTVSGTVMAKDGLAVIVGGLIDESVSEVESKVPFLGNLPLLGYFFSRKTDVRQRTELVVMIRPYILNTPAESAAISRLLVDELSIHPLGSDAKGTLNSFQPHEVLKPEIKKERLNIFKFHNIDEEDE